MPITNQNIQLYYRSDLLINELDEKEFLYNRFNTEDVDKYLRYVKQQNLGSEMSKLDDNYNFVCIQTAHYAFQISRMSESGYYKVVTAAFQSRGDEKIDFTSFLCELVQNSIDHSTKDENSPIEIKIDIGNNNLIYEHNGRPFQFEGLHPTSTMQGLLTTSTTLKKYDFRRGMFGIGFKSWIFFFKKFHLTSILVEESSLYKLRLSNMPQ